MKKITKQWMPIYSLVALLGLLVGGCAFSDMTADSELDGDSDTAGPSTDGDLDFEVEVSEIIEVTPPQQWLMDENHTPEYVHMTWQHEPSTTITLQWQTDVNDIETYTPKVWFVPADEVEGSGGDVKMPYADQFVAEGAGFNYEAFFNSEKQIFAQWEVELLGLEPNTLYYYRVGTWNGFDKDSGSFDRPNLGPAHTFKTAPEKGSREPFSVMLAGDSRGGYDGISANIERLKAYDADFWLFNGDMTDAGGQGEWFTWYTAMSPILLDTVLMPVQGNHEIVAELYYWQFALPQEPELPEDRKEHAWSVDYGNIHFIGLNSNTTSLVEEQTDWLEADLKAASQDEKIDWIVAMFHHPAYSACKHGSTERVLANWTPLFEKYNVVLAFSGHDHNYERTHPIRGDQVVDASQGITYVTAGGFYSDGYSNGQDWWTVKSFHGDIGNMVHLEANGLELNATAYDGDGNVLDTFSLSK